MSDTQILDLIQKARETKATRLNLSNRKLTKLPPEIGQLIELQVLWLNDNQLEHLPPEIGQLQNLRRLRLHNNRLTSLPPEIGQLTELRDLTLYSNQLTALPPQIGNLHNLQRLIMAGNKISKALRRTISRRYCEMDWNSHSTVSRDLTFNGGFRVPAEKRASLAASSSIWREWRRRWRKHRQWRVSNARKATNRFRSQSCFSGST
jgi:Leucine-rich repeat (LRR) protein